MFSATYLPATVLSVGVAIALAGCQRPTHDPEVRDAAFKRCIDSIGTISAVNEWEYAVDSCRSIASAQASSRQAGAKQ